MSGKTRGLVNGLLRIVFVGVILLLQILLMLALNVWLRQFSSTAYILIQMLGFIAVLFLMKSTDNASYKIVWMIIILIAPLAGLLLYLAWGRRNISKREKELYDALKVKEKEYLEQDEAVWCDFKRDFSEYAPLARQLLKAGFPLHEGAKRTAYYPNGETFFPALHEELRKAEKYIFIEFFIIKEGETWDEIKEILIDRANAGVKIRILYDDIGSLVTQKADFRHELEAYGIEVEVFNPVNHCISEFYLNYRNHQKIVAIDGKIGFTGGMNIGDEYSNRFVRFGYWKDSFMMIEGTAVNNFIAIFLKMWNLTKKNRDEDYGFWYNQQERYLIEEKGYYQPFADGSANNPMNPGEDLYKQMISGAKEYCYISSPYLALDDEMISILIRTANSGVDVRLLLPSMHDHWYTKIATHSFFERLLEGGVSIYEYTPGMIHAKMCVCDDKTAILGSINMDFRSFFLHYEDAVWLCGVPIIMDIKNDMLKAMEESDMLNFEEWKKRPLHDKMAQLLIAPFVPIL